MIRYDFTKNAEKEFLKLPAGIQKRIIKKLEFFLKNPHPLIFARRMYGGSSFTYRFKIGHYRLIFDWEGKSILILKVGHRKEIYR